MKERRGDGDGEQGGEGKKREMNRLKRGDINEDTDGGGIKQSHLVLSTPWDWARTSRAGGGKRLSWNNRGIFYLLFSVSILVFCSFFSISFFINYLLNICLFVCCLFVYVFVYLFIYLLIYRRC